MSWLDAVAGYGAELKNTVGSYDWLLEDDEPAPTTYRTQAAAEKSAEGSSTPVVETAQNNTGETVVVTASPLASYQPYIIGGVALFVLLFALLLMRGSK